MKGRAYDKGANEGGEGKEGVQTSELRGFNSQ